MSKNPKQSWLEKLRARSPIALQEHAERQIIKPVDILEPQTNNATSTQVDKPTNPQISNPTSRKLHKSTKPLAEKPTSQRTNKPISPQIEKYTTHLRPATIKAIKQYALDQDVHDYDIVQEALDQFFSLKEQR